MWDTDHAGAQRLQGVLQQAHCCRPEASKLNGCTMSSEKLLWLLPSTSTNQCSTHNLYTSWCQGQSKDCSSFAWTWAQLP